MSFNNGQVKAVADMTVTVFARPDADQQEGYCAFWVLLPDFTDAFIVGYSTYLLFL